MCKRVFIIADIGINHNGDIKIAKELMLGAKEAGCDAVKFQKRDINKVYTKSELDKDRESPFGDTNRDQKMGLELKKEDYDEIDRYSKEIDIPWFASPWDLNSVAFLDAYNTQFNKIPSARLGHIDLLEAIAKQGKHTFISTGMSNLEEISTAVDIFTKHKCPFELMHCTSIYPANPDTLNLLTIRTLKHLFDCKVGYSGHEVGLTPSIVAVALGATSIERHITLNRSMYGSDQAASIEVQGFQRLVGMIREAEQVFGTGYKSISEAEKKVREKLWRTTDVI